MYGHDYTNDRYSALDQINPANVSPLVPRWIFQTGIVASFETTPVVSNGVMYITTAYNHLFALNARTGKQLWRYDHKLGGTEIFCCGPVNRGVGLGYGMVYMATLDAQLVALDAATGKVAWAKQVADPTLGYAMTIAPLVYKNIVIVGTSGAEYGVRGYLQAFEATTGAAMWRFYLFPPKGGEGEGGTPPPHGAPPPPGDAPGKAAARQ